MHLRRHGRSHTTVFHAAFTMIELLTVIAIIAILAGIIFPVAGTVRENARRSSTMSNMREIQMAVKQYQLDNRSYPEYLFGPAVDANGNESATNVLAMDRVAEIVNSTAIDPVSRKIKALYSNGLFPEYVSSLERFSSPNNTVSRTTQGSGIRTVSLPYLDKAASPPQVKTLTRAFYTYDAFDASPAITGDNRIDAATFFPRYSRLWTPIDRNNTSANYKRQLLWRNPPDDTYLTMTTWHVPSGGKVVVLFLNGTAKVVDVTKLKNDKDVGNGAYETTKPYPMYTFTATD